MREIKFRAWNKVCHIMHRRVERREEFLIYIKANDTGKQILMQYTGLKDKNGKEIYESDIVNYSDNSLTKQTGVVEWCDDLCGFYAIANNGDNEGNMDVELHADHDFEVIGIFMRIQNF